jgi:hypothetical protein
MDVGECECEERMEGGWQRCDSADGDGEVENRGPTTMVLTP